MASWTVPRTWVAGELITASIGNVQWRDNEAYLKDSPTFDGSVIVTSNLSAGTLLSYAETKTAPSISAGALTLDCALGTYFAVSLNAAVTITVTNPPTSGRALGITIVFTADGTLRAVTWPSGTVWPAGVAPTMTSTLNKRDIITLITYDGGTSYFGIVVGQNY